MDFKVTASSQRYLSALDANQMRLQKAQAQVSSGLRVGQPSDDPASLGDIFRLQAKLSVNEQTQANLRDAQTELNTADVALQSSLTAVEAAISLSSQGMSANLNAQDLSAMAIQAAGLQDTLVSLSQTTVNGKFIFSGDQGDHAAYQLDPTQPDGVLESNTGAATRVITDLNGAHIATARTAQEIYDSRDASGNPLSGNVFKAINDLHTALVNGDQPAIIQANVALKAALDHLNQQLFFYGTAETRVSDALDLAGKFQLTEQQALSQVQDADLPSAALALSQAQTQQQAILAVEAKIQQLPNLFSMLG